MTGQLKRGTNMKVHNLIQILIATFCIGGFQRVQAVVPPPDGGYPGGNTAEGTNALLSLTTGGYNAAIGWQSLRGLATGNYNTGVGAATLALNNGNENTATGTAALLFNTGNGNTANGAFALFSNTTGVQNTASGDQALFSNTDGNDNAATGFATLYYNTQGSNNTATGFEALYSNATGSQNTATGRTALGSNTIGSNNTANGSGALEDNTEGGDNTAIGYVALFGNTSGDFNTAVGSQALRDNETGDSNTAIGDSAGFNITGSGNVCIGAGVNGVAGESNITRIRNVYQSVATERAVYVTSDNRIGTLSSSSRYKEQVKPMEKTSESIHSLRPVSFRYKKEVDSAQSVCFGLIAEEVADVNPNLVTLDCEGKPETVRYEAINAMLLNEFLKEHRKVEAQECKIREQESSIASLKNEFEKLNAQQQKEMQLLRQQLEHQAVQIQRVTADQEMRDSAPGTQVVVNRP
jgi:Chaperone of endosialidase